MNKIVSLFWLGGWLITAFVCYERSLFQAKQIPVLQTHSAAPAELSAVGVHEQPILPEAQNKAQTYSQNN